MLLYRLLDGHKGLLLMGDHTTMAMLREIALDVDLRTPLLQNKDDGTPLSALAYEARKAYEHKREVIHAPEELPNQGPLCGVEMFWPSLLAQQRLLRMSLAYIDHGKRHQAITYALEAVVEDGLKDAFGDDAQSILRQVDSLLAPELDALLDKCECFLSWSATQRRQQLMNLLAPQWLINTDHPKN